ncbi:MAG TPA: type VI secretion system membrane subunit TssM, partial [Rhodothermales bacterium]|nr:type VI secretion system membrane subunit TssM [Rhodothermales bacterium]
MPKMNPTALAGGALAVILVAGLSLASIFRWPWWVRLTIIGVVVVLAIVLLIVKLVQAQRHAKGIEQALKAGGDAQHASARPDRQAEIRQLQEQFDRAIKTLKESKLTRGRRGADALYALPWYLFVGPPAAGKTTAIQQSGLRFPLGANRVRGVGGTRNCDWFFADSAILLDTAGRYMVEEEDAAEWNSFLASLKKHRKHQPINGVLVGMSLSDLGQMSSADVELHAEAFRQRLDELVRLLGVRFPVYLVFTKADLLAGFVEFFGDLTKAEREQVWGATFELDDPRPPVEAFKEEFDAIGDALLDERVARMARPMKREERQAVFAFPLEVTSLRDRLSLFVDQLFLPNPYQDSPRFRGFYFSSGTQEGAPIDRVISAIAEQMGIAAQPVGAPRYDVETKSYFLNDLFTRVVIPDQHVVRRTAPTKRSLPVALIASIVGVLLAAGILTLSAFQSRGDIRTVQTASATFAANRVGGTADQAVIEMDSLRGAVARARTGPGWLYDQDALLDPADDVWLTEARRFVDAHGIEALERRIEASSRAGLSGEAWQALYEDLQAYLLLSQETRRLAGDSARSNRQVLRRHLVALGLGQGIGVSDRGPMWRVYGAFVDALGEGRVE